MGDRFKYLQSLIAQGLSEQDIESLMDQWDLENAPEATNEEDNEHNVHAAATNDPMEEDPSVDPPLVRDYKMEGRPLDGPYVDDTEDDELTKEEVNDFWDNNLYWKEKNSFNKWRLEKYGTDWRTPQGKTINEKRTNRIDTELKHKREYILEIQKKLNRDAEEEEKKLQDYVFSTSDDEQAELDADNINQYFFFDSPDFLRRDAKLDFSGGSTGPAPESYRIYNERLKKRQEEWNMIAKASGIEAANAWVKENPIDLDAQFTSDKEYQEYLKEYLGEDKYKEYLQYQKDGILLPNTKHDQDRYQSIQDNNDYLLRTKKAEHYLNDVPSRIQEKMNMFDNIGFKNMKEADEFLNDSDPNTPFGWLKNQEKLISDQYNELVESDLLPTIERMIELNQKADGLDQDSEEFDNLVNEYGELMETIEDSGIDELYNAYAQNWMNYSHFRDKWGEKLLNKVDEAWDAKIMQKAISKDYSNWTRFGLKMEKFFVGDLIMNGSALAAEAIVRLNGRNLGIALSGDSGKAAVDAIVARDITWAKNYNEKLDKEMEETLPGDFKLEDIGNGKVDFWDWFGQAVANNGPSIVSGMVPLGGALRGAHLLKLAKAAKKSGNLQKAAQLTKEAARWRKGSMNTTVGLFFGAESGGKYGEIEKDKNFALQILPSKIKARDKKGISRIEKDMLNEEIIDLERRSSFNFAQRASTAYAYGGSAALFERLGSLRWIQETGDLITRVGVEELKGEAYRSLPRWIGGTIVKTGKGAFPVLGRGLTIENVEELGTEISHNFFDMLILGDPNKTMFSGIDADFFANTSVTLLGIGAPKVGMNIRNTFVNETRTRKEFLENATNAEALDKLNEKLKYGNLTGDARKEALKERRRLEKALALNDAKSTTKLRGLSYDQILELSDKQVQINHIRQQQLSLGQQGKIDKDTDELRKELEKKEKEIQKDRDDILEFKENNIRKVLIEEIKQNAAKKGIDVNDDWINSRLGDGTSLDGGLLYYVGLNDFFENVVLATHDGGYFNFESVEDLEKQLKEAGYSQDEIDTARGKMFEETLDKDGKKVFTPKGNGTIFAANGRNDIFVNNKNIRNQILNTSKFQSRALYAAATPLEELFHLRNRKENIVDKDGKLNKKATQAVKDAIKTLRHKLRYAKDKGVLKDLIKRFEDYGYRKKGEATDYEELLAQMNNAVALGFIKLEDIVENKTIGDFVRGLVNNVMGDLSWQLELDSDQNIFRFIQDYQASLRNQQGIKTAPEEDREDIEKQSKALDIDIEVNKVKVDGVYSKTQGEGDAKNIQAFTDVFEQGLLDKALYKEFQKVSQADGQVLPGIDSDAFSDFKQEMYIELLPHAKNFNADVNDSFFGWLMGFKGFKALNVRKAKGRKKGVGFKEKYETDITDPVFGNIVAKDVNTFDLSEIMEELSSLVDVTIDKDGNLKMESKLFSPEALEEIENLTIREVKLTKLSMYDSASKNRKVKPFVAALKKVLQKQADIIVRKEMGKMKDEAYPKWLKTHKDQIIANLTKTYLSKFLPEAVQKSIGGEKVYNEDGELVGFNPTWVDYDEWSNVSVDQIDKEIASVHGRTARHQIMRKKPDFNISDEAWLDIFIKNGKALGMKKESLSEQLGYKVGFDMFRSQAQLEKGGILDAFKVNVELKDQLLKENFAAELGMQLDMGGFEKLNRVIRPDIVKLIPQGIDGQAFTKALLNALDDIESNYQSDMSAAITEDDKWKTKALQKKYPSWLAGVVKDVGASGIKQSLQFVQLLGELGFDSHLLAEYKKQENLGAKKFQNLTTTERENLAKDNKIFAKVLAPILDVMYPTGDIQILGYHREYLDPANKKVDKEATKKEKERVAKKLGITVEQLAKRKEGKGLTQYQKDEDGNLISATYNKSHNEIKSIISQNKGKLEINYLDKTKDKEKYTQVENDLNWALPRIRLFNSATGRMNAIIKDIYSVAGVDNQLKKLKEHKAEILEANKANDIVLTHIIKTFRQLNQGVGTYMNKDGKITNTMPFSILHLLQASTNLKSGIRGLSGWDLLTIDGQKRTKKEIDAKGDGLRYGEHLLANVALTPRLAMAIFNNKQNFDVDDYLRKYLIGFTQLSTWKPTADALDEARGKSNPYLDIDRINALENKHKDNIYDWEGNKFLTYRANQIIEESKLDENFRKAVRFDKANKAVGPTKGITVLDFDDTLATSDSKVIVKLPPIVVAGKQYGYETWDNGRVKMTSNATEKITPAEFAENSAGFESIGATFDFSEFNKVVKGKKGPLFDLALKRQKKFGSKDIFVLTARPQASARAIQKFARGLGLYIPLKNIVGLEDGRPEAKADWMAGKVGEGYNNFYFADDALKNVKAVQDVLNKFDVKSDVQQAIKLNKAVKLDRRFNQILEETKGVGAEKKFSDAAARVRGDKKKEGYVLPASAEDFEGLLYAMLAPGAKGEAQYKWLKENLMDPFARGHDAINRAKQNLANEYEALKKKYSDIHKKLKKDIGYNEFTFDQAIRIYIWHRNGEKIPGLSKTDVSKITKIVSSDGRLNNYANELAKITRAKQHWKPDENWTASTIQIDMLGINHETKRKDYLKTWIENKDIIFSKENLNKIQAIYGTDFREALEDILYRMQHGTNRNFGQNKHFNDLMNWVNNSIGVIMFFNTRSAVLQGISFANFVNWTDNNMLKAGMAFANQPQFWKDFSMLFNSDFLKQRRSGLRQDINWQEIAEHVSKSKNKTKAAIGWMLQKGFLPTQMMDSFAIALGGASMFRNRVNTYMGQGLSKLEAEEKAFLDFQEIAEKTQQSSRPDLISQQQASPIGRVILAFQNVTMQYTRLGKKAVLDLFNRRKIDGLSQFESDQTHLSKIIYYFGVQNFIFNAMQNALFALAFDDETEEKEKEKYFMIGNGMLDSILRGLGYKMAIGASLKNMYFEYNKQKKKPMYKQDMTYVLLQGINASPPLGSKARKFYSAMQTFKFRSKEISHKDLLDPTNPIHEAMANLVSVATNAPTDRLYYKQESLQQVMDSELASWQRIFMFFGWRDWQLGVGRSKPKDKTNPTISQEELRQLQEFVNPYDKKGFQRQGFKRKGFEKKGFEKD